MPQGLGCAGTFSIVQYNLIVDSPLVIYTSQLMLYVFLAIKFR